MLQVGKLKTLKLPLGELHQAAGCDTMDGSLHQSREACHESVTLQAQDGDQDTWMQHTQQLVIVI